jgi:hypothetical protein
MHKLVKQLMSNPAVSNYTEGVHMDFDFRQFFTKLWMHELRTDFAKSI